MTHIVIVGGGAGGVTTAASILKRRPKVQITIIEPQDIHYYQPGWTLVGGGVFDQQQTIRPLPTVLPDQVQRIKGAVAEFDPENNTVILADGHRVSYDMLVVSPGIKLDWDAVEGLTDALGREGVTSNYRFDLAPYTWKLVQTLNKGEALFTQPPMPIKCAGAPQKAMYLSCDAWRRRGVLNDINVQFCNAGAVLFGVADYVPALMEYVSLYQIGLQFNNNLVAIDAGRKVAKFKIAKPDGAAEFVERPYDMIHVCPPQKAPDFIRSSPLADQAGWVDVDQFTLQHKRYQNIFGLGDACSAPNAKTAAAVRKQAPVVAENLLAAVDGGALTAAYDGYGSCPLTVERGKIVLAEFGYGGKLLPTFPTALVKGTKPTRSAWFLKEKMLPAIYWRLMLRGHEWLAEPKQLSDVKQA
ncbi:MAG: FAD/NAD(P)-binding oxidoreductase [Parvularculaceae bacterium]